jgi:large subunit ribosomal protein L18
MLDKQLRRIKRHGSIRKKISGTGERPRVCVRRSLKHFYIQAIDDIKAVTLASASTLIEEFKKSETGAKKVESAKRLGSFFAERLKQKGIRKVAFDRAGYQYHGRVKALAEAMREAGIEF